MDIKIGDKLGKYTVKGIKEIVHGKLYPNTQVTHHIAMMGKRGAKIIAYRYVSGKIVTTITQAQYFGWFEGNQVLDGR